MKSPQKFCFVPDDFQDGSLPESQDWWGAGYLVELVDPLLSRLALVGRGGVRVNVVRVDVERHQTQRLEGGWEHCRMADHSKVVPTLNKSNLLACRWWC